jgi:hypothetical protein
MEPDDVLGDLALIERSALAIQAAARDLQLAMERTTGESNKRWLARRVISLNGMAESMLAIAADGPCSRDVPNE